MKIREGFVLRRIGGQPMALALGEASREFNGLIRLNESGAFLWTLLQEEHTAEELLDAQLRRYDVSAAVAKRDIAAFLDTLRQAHALA